MTKLTHILKTGASGAALAMALVGTAHAQATQAPPAPPAGAGPSPTSSQVRPATASDKAPEQSSNAVEAVKTALPGAAAQTDASTQEIVVTGTSIRGVAPVGSNLISVGRQAIEQTGVQTVQQILKTVPAVVGLGSAGQGSFGSADASGTNAPTIHGLGASASNSTLIIIDGHRFPLAGINHALADPNILPPNAIERVEVLPDGASSVYGSDAVAGVINFITRRRFNGVEVSGQLGYGKGYRTQQAGVVAGHTWDTGWLLGAYNYSHRSNLAYSSHGYLDPFNADEAAAAGLDLTSTTAQNRANLGSFFCDPATVQIGSNIYRYNSANGTYGTPVSNAQANAFCNTTQFADLLPDERRNNFMLKGEQQIGDRLTVGVDFVFSNLKDYTRTSRAGGNNSNAVTTTVYGPGAVGTTVNGVLVTPGMVNPFFQPIPGTTANSYTVRVPGDALLGPGAYNVAGEKIWYVNPHAEYKFSEAWRGSVSAVVGDSDSISRDVGRLCTSCAVLALNGGPVSLPSGQSVSNLPLTTANALDIWHLGSANLTSASVLQRLSDSAVDQDTKQGFEQFRGQVNGDVFQLPGGMLKLALGAEYLHYTIGQSASRPNNLGPASTNSTYLHLDYKRNTKSAFAEVFVPIISPDMHVPLAYSLDLNLAGRYDKYSDFGSTKNPKIAANWEVVRGIRVRGNWARSFVAPALTSRGADAFGTTAETSITGGPTNLAVPISLFPNVTSIPGAVCNTTTCTIGTATIRGLQINGGNAALQPQKGRTWSLGADILPTLLHGLRLSATWWHNQITGGITAPSPVFAVLGDPTRLTLFPGGVTGSSPALVSLIGNRPVQTTITGTYNFIYDNRQGNVLNLRAEGIDAEAYYRYGTPWGGVDADVSVSYKTKFDQSFGTGPSFSVLNTTGFNTTFPSIRLDLRANVGVDAGPVRAVVYMNHSGAYRNWSGNAINPVIITNGVPAGGDPVKAYTTFDGHIDFKIPGGWTDYLPKATVYLDVTNIFNKRPPFYNNTNGGYDPFSGNPLGRIVSVGLRSRWGGSASRRPALVAPAALPAPQAPATQTCADGTVVLATAVCATPPPPPAAAAPERG